jgi:hypothetical protein
MIVRSSRSVSREGQRLDVIPYSDLARLEVRPDGGNEVLAQAGGGVCDVTGREGR